MYHGARLTAVFCVVFLLWRLARSRIPGGPRSAGCGSAMCSNHRHRAGVRPGLQGAALRHVLHGAVFCSAAGLQVVNGCSDNLSLTGQCIEPVLHSNDLPSFTFWCRV